MGDRDILTSVSEMQRSLESLNKRAFHKKERESAKVYISKLLDDPDLLNTPTKELGLHKSVQEARKLKYENGESVIPEGPYCNQCPYLDMAKNKDVQNNGFCWFMEEGDWQIDGLSLLWDGCKECGVKDGEEFDQIELEDEN